MCSVCRAIVGSGQPGMPAADHPCQLPRIKAGCQLLCVLWCLRVPIVLEVCGQQPLSEDLSWREIDSGRQR